MKHKKKQDFTKEEGEEGDWRFAEDGEGEECEGKEEEG